MKAACKIDPFQFSIQKWEEGEYKVKEEISPLTLAQQLISGPWVGPHGNVTQSDSVQQQ